ncbi:UDP-N-acetylglucosamine 1-carboxyvinyltransferase, partial [Acinetobacter baumannii]
MDRLRIIGGNRLEGAVTISGAKNAALPQIAAALLSPYPLELTNLPAVNDVENMLGVVQLHGARIDRSPHAATI